MPAANRAAPRSGDEERNIRHPEVPCVCVACGRPLVESVVRAQLFGINMISNTLIYGDRTAQLGPVQARIMEALMSTGQASRVALGACLNDGSMRKTIDVHIHKLRRTIQVLTSGDVSIQPVLGWGYKLLYHGKR